MNESTRKLAILVTGGLAPGINPLIAALVKNASDEGFQVIGLLDGFKHLLTGKAEYVSLTRTGIEGIDSRGSVLRTSRSGPRNDEEVNFILQQLLGLDVTHLVTIGGDGSANAVRKLVDASDGRLHVLHVLKTIDNDVPGDRSLGFVSAAEEADRVLRSLIAVARSSNRTGVAVSMGRYAGHLVRRTVSTNAGVAGFIPEQCGESFDPTILWDAILGHILKRRVLGEPPGVVVLAEGLMEKFTEGSMPGFENPPRDERNRIIYADVDFDALVTKALVERCLHHGISESFFHRTLGHELQGAEPCSYDRELAAFLGFEAVQAFKGNTSGVMLSRTRDEQLLAIPFSSGLNRDGTIPPMLVDLGGPQYAAAWRQMRLLLREDLNRQEFVRKAAANTRYSPEKFREVFAKAASFGEPT